MTKLLRIASTASLCSWVLFASVSPAHAQDDETATTLARERFKEGVQSFDQKQYDSARVAFLQAYALKRHPAVLLNLAQSELRSGHEADAAKHFSMYLREAKDATPAEREGAEAGLFAAKAVVGEVAVKVDVEGATVLVDGNEEEGLTPLPDVLYLTPGNHQLEVRKHGKSSKASVALKAGEATEVSLRLGGARESAPAPAASEPSEESARSAPPEYDSGSSSGGREGFFPWVGHTPLAWVGGGLTVLGIAGGIGFGVSSKQSFEDADTVAEKIRSAAEDDNLLTAGICNNPNAAVNSPSYSNTVPPAERAAQYQDACSKHQDNISNGDTMKTLSIVSWVVAGAAAAGTVVYYFADSGEGSGESAGKPRSPRVGAVVGPGFVSLQGEF